MALDLTPATTTTVSEPCPIAGGLGSSRAHRARSGTIDDKIKLRGPSGISKIRRKELLETNLTKGMPPCRKCFDAYSALCTNNRRLHLAFALLIWYMTTLSCTHIYQRACLIRRSIGTRAARRLQALASRTTTAPRTGCSPATATLCKRATHHPHSIPSASNYRVAKNIS